MTISQQVMDEIAGDERMDLSGEPIDVAQGMLCLGHVITRIYSGTEQQIEEQAAYDREHLAEVGREEERQNNKRYLFVKEDETLYTVTFKFTSSNQFASVGKASTYQEAYKQAKEGFPFEKSNSFRQEAEARFTYFYHNDLLQDVRRGLSDGARKTYDENKAERLKRIDREKETRLARSVLDSVLNGPEKEIRL